MAAISGVRALVASRSSTNSIVAAMRSRTSSNSPFVRISRRKLSMTISRLPVELGCVQSLMPLHSVTASALLKSMLSIKTGGWAWLSEGFTLPL